jgi:glutamyl-tRNA synthetase
MKRLTEITEFTDFFFVSKLAYVEKDLVPKGMDKASAARALEAVLAQVQPLPQFDAPSLEAVLRPLAETLGLKTGQLFGAVRTAVTGKTVTPPLFETMAVLGRERSLERLRGALAFLQG